MYKHACTHTHPHYSHSLQNRSFAKGGLCKLPHTDDHINSLQLLTLCWGYQDGHWWHLALSSQEAKFVNWLNYFIWNQNFYLFSSSQEEKNLFYCHLLLFTKVTKNFSKRDRKIFAFFTFKKIWGKHVSDDWFSSQFYHVARTRACRMSSNTFVQYGQYELLKEGSPGQSRLLFRALNVSSSD